MRTTNLVIRLAPEVKTALEGRASAGGVTVAEYVRRMIYARLRLPLAEAETRYGAPDPLANLHRNAPG